MVWSGFTIYGRKLTRTYRPIEAIAFVQIAGTLLLLPLAFFATRLAPEPLYIQLRHITWPTALGALYLAGPCSVFGYYAWYRGVEALGPVRTSVFAYLNPLFAIGAGLVLLRESPTLFTLMGGSMILLGVYATQRSRLSPAGALPSRNPVP